MKTLIVANWKLNPVSQKDAKKLFDAVKKHKKNKQMQVIICPPFVYLPMLKGLELGAQNMFWEDNGAFTGEISAAQIKDLSVEYVIIGHSERRRYFAETDQIVNKKIKKALEANLIPIFCIGETLEENQQNKKQEVLERQIMEGLKNVSRMQAKNLVIAYEPVWAIGTGNNCSPDQAQSSVLLVRRMLSQLYSREIADSVSILYGGSVNSKNSADYMKNAGVNGLLVGGASLDAKEFIGIIMSA